MNSIFKSGLNIFGINIEAMLSLDLYCGSFSKLDAALKKQVISAVLDIVVSYSSLHVFSSPKRILNTSGGFYPYFFSSVPHGVSSSFCDSMWGSGLDS